MLKNKFKIFILEDEEVYELLYKQILQKHVTNYKCEIDFYTTINKATEALDTFGVNYWDLFICDLKLPLGNGGYSGEYFHTFSLLKKYNLKNVVIVSGYISPEIMQKAKELGAMNVIQKPINFELLAVNLNFIIKSLIGES